MTQEEIDNCEDIERLRRKEDQAWEMAGLARMDGDRTDCKRRTDEALAIRARIKEILS